MLDDTKVTIKNIISLRLRLFEIYKIRKFQNFFLFRGQRSVDDQFLNLAYINKWSILKNVSYLNFRGKGQATKPRKFLSTKVPSFKVDLLIKN